MWLFQKAKHPDSDFGFSALESGSGGEEWAEDNDDPPEISGELV
jgi:hypothetical protein